jgi:3-dehydroquinate synthase
MAIRKQIIYTDAAKELSLILKDRDYVVITDKNVARMYKEKIFKEARTIVVAGGERCKNLRTVEKIYNKLLDLGADRKTVIVGIGGGVVCDIAGFVADTFKRGCPLMLVPTTLLAQVDAAIGGKNGVNLKGYKNMTGTFKDPEKIIIDTHFLKTLDENDFNNGVAEIIKSAAIYDKKFFERLEKTVLFDLPEMKLKAIIKKTVKIKNDIVKDDPYESGIRKILNFGHTIGHALELRLRWIHHGEAVSIGMAAACRIAEKLNGLNPKDSKRMEEILKLNKLPVKISKLAPTDKIVDSIIQDKKKSGKDIDMILLKGIGHPVIYRMEIRKIGALIDDIR